MKMRVFPDKAQAALAAAELIAGAARSAVVARGRFIVAFSGGSTPGLMLDLLATQELPWEQVFVVQVDERLAPAGHPERNLTQLQASLRRQPRLPPGHIHPLPVEAADLSRAGAQYTAKLRQLAGSPPVLDLVHLGLGTDGHTASLVPGDRVLDLTHQDVALTGPYQGRRRLTLTYPVLNRARRIVWLVTGTDKADMAARLYAGDTSIPAGRIVREPAWLILDEAAAARIKPS